MTDAVTLTIPRRKPFHGVARLVVGGLAARRDISFEELEDIQLALDEILASPLAAGDAVTVEVVVETGAAAIAIGPVDGDAVRRELERPDDGADGIGLRRLLEAVAEDVRVESRGDAEWLRLEKTVGAAGAETSA